MNEAIAKLALEHYKQTGERLQRVELNWMQTHCIDTAVNLPHNAPT